MSVDIENKDMDSRLDDFKNAMGKLLDEKDDELRKVWKEYPVKYVEDMLQDRVIVYMGDKETERKGTPDDVLRIGALSYILWVKKMEEPGPAIIAEGEVKS